MKGLRLTRKATTENTEVSFEFDVNAQKWLVKNFTEGKIYVAFEAGVSKDDSVLIPAGCAQVIETRNTMWADEPHATVYILAEAASEDGVEVQVLIW